MKSIPTEALDLMSTQGGSFVKALAALYYAADPVNRERVAEAFPTYFNDYAQKAARVRNQQRAA